MTPQQKEDFFAYIFIVVLCIAMSFGSVTNAIGVDGWWIPATKWTNVVLWMAMVVLSVNMLYRFFRQFDKKEKVEEEAEPAQ